MDLVKISLLDCTIRGALKIVVSLEEKLMLKDGRLLSMVPIPKKVEYVMVVHNVGLRL